jgi:hypothetical protein
MITFGPGGGGMRMITLTCLGYLLLKSLCRHRLKIIEAVLEEIRENSCLASTTVSTILEELEVLPISPVIIFVVVILIHPPPFLLNKFVTKAGILYVI